MPTINPYLVIAQSGRALAASAYKAGIKTHVIDQFNDVDTKNYTLSTQIVNENESGICSEHLRALLDDYEAIPLQGIIVGSGFENQPDILNELDERFRLIGNKAACVKACKDPKYFFTLLQSLDIPYPSASLEPPVKYGGWLAKEIGGTGGRHVDWVDSDTLSQKKYYQKFIRGRSLSATFIANGICANIIGINETWACDPDNNNFSYGGAITLPEIEPAIASTLNEIIAVLVEHMSLVGLCGLDIILDTDGVCHVLEINPRPVATFELHEQNQSLFYAHIEACMGRLTPLSKNTGICQGHEIFYLANDFVVPEITWPEWVHDRPNNGMQIASGAPICTIRAAANSPKEVKASLTQRKAMLDKLLGLERIAA